MLDETAGIRRKVLLLLTIAFIGNQDNNWENLRIVVCFAFDSTNKKMNSPLTLSSFMTPNKAP